MRVLALACLIAAVLATRPAPAAAIETGDIVAARSTIAAGDADDVFVIDPHTGTGCSARAPR